MALGPTPNHLQVLPPFLRAHGDPTGNLGFTRGEIESPMTSLDRLNTGQPCAKRAGTTHTEPTTSVVLCLGHIALKK